MRDIITLECTVCKNHNYTSIKNKKNDPDKVHVNKYCSHCRKHTEHKETK